MAGVREALTLWRISDGRPGHDAQSLGLCQALRRLLPCELTELRPPPVPALLYSWLRRDFPVADRYPTPDLIIGAGHGTHLAMICARRARGGNCVLLMRPSLPRSWFDLCLIPRHDGIREGGNVVLTDGVINTQVPASERLPGTGLILIGGPSRHHDWDEDALMRALEEILTVPGISWLISDSPRTPVATTGRLSRLASSSVTFRHWHQLPASELATELGKRECVWITADSMTMIYEGITAGGRVGILPAPPRRRSRITDTAGTLAAAGQVTLYEQWQGNHTLKPPALRLDEAGRCARIILQRFGWTAATDD